MPFPLAALTKVSLQRDTEVAHQAQTHRMPAAARGTPGCASQAPEGLASPRRSDAPSLGGSLRSHLQEDPR